MNLTDAERELEHASQELDRQIAGLRRLAEEFLQQPATRRALLIVEDERAVALLLARVLREIPDLEVHAVATLGEAVAVFAAPGLPPQVLLLDVQLPDGAGWQLASHAPREVRVILMSGALPEEVLHRLGERTIAGYLVKPFEVEEVLRLVREALGDPPG